jgi:hypothetical protein
MKNRALATALAFTVLSSLPAQAQTDPLPNSGTYFITSMKSDEALQPAGNTVGQNVLLHDYDRCGLQKWVIDRKIDPKTKKPTNRYTIRLAGESDDLNFQPHPVADCPAMIGSDKSVFVVESGGDSGMLIKSVARNGDALFVFTQPPLASEAKFGPSDGSPKFRWKFTRAE